MKDFEPNNSKQDNKVMAAEQRQVKAPEHLTASMTIHPGHTVYEFDLATGDIVEAKIERIEAVLNVINPLATGRTKNIRKKIIQRPQCMYASALNVKNAIKKFAKMYAELITSGQIVREPIKPEY